MKKFITGLALLLPTLALLSGCWIRVEEHQVWLSDAPIVTVNHIPYPAESYEKRAYRHYDIVDTNFSYEFKASVAFPEYYEFYMFRPGQRSLCAGQKEPTCSVNLRALAGNEVIENFIRNSDDTFYVSPIGRPKNCTGLDERGIGGELRLCAGVYDLSDKEIHVHGDTFIDSGVRIANGVIFTHGIYITGNVMLSSAAIGFNSPQSYINGLELENGSLLASQNNIYTQNRRDRLLVENLKIDRSSGVSIFGDDRVLIEFRNIRFTEKCSPEYDYGFFEAWPSRPRGAFDKQISGATYKDTDGDSYYFGEASCQEK